MMDRHGEYFALSVVVYTYVNKALARWLSRSDVSSTAVLLPEAGFTDLSDLVMKRTDRCLTFLTL